MINLGDVSLLLNEGEVIMSSDQKEVYSSLWSRNIVNPHRRHKGGRLMREDEKQSERKERRGRIHVGVDECGQEG